MTRADKEALNPKYTKKIIILQKLDYRGRSKFYILHKPNKWSSPSILDIPKYSRVRYTLNTAESVAFKLIKNYEKIFMS